MSDALRDLLGVLELERQGDDRFAGRSSDPDGERIYGGQVLAQALVAAGRTVDHWLAHSLHAYFLRPGDPALPVVFEVERIRDGRSFATRRVVALQKDRAIFNMSASYHAEETGPEHQLEAPDMPRPEQVPTEAEFMESRLPKIPEEHRHWYTTQRPIELRPLEPIDPIRPVKRPGLQKVWLRTAGALPESPGLHQSLLAWASDWSLLDSCILPLGMSFLDGGLQVASLDHALWFHRPFRCDEWLLYVQDSPSLAGARGYSTGAVFDTAGRRVASVSQEGLIRVRS